MLNDSDRLIENLQAENDMLRLKNIEYVKMSMCWDTAEELKKENLLLKQKWK